VQWVIRPQSAEHPDYRGYAGMVAGGVLKTGDEVVVLPSGMTSRITKIETFDGPVEEAFPPMSVTVRLADDVDVSRGDMICRTRNAPTATQDLDAMVCWFHERPMAERVTYGIKHTTNSARCQVRDLQYRLDINTLSRDDSAGQLHMNDIGRVQLRVTAPLFVDEYRRNQTTGSFILIDESTHETVGAGMIIGTGD